MEGVNFRTMWKRNWFWFVMSILVFVLCYLLTVGLDTWRLLDSTRLVLLGNFFNVPNFYIFFTYLPLIVYTGFMGKIIWHRLRNRNANKVFDVFNSFLILQVTYLTFKINWINEKNILDENTLSLWSKVLHISLPIQFFLITTLVIVCWKGEKRSRSISENKTKPDLWGNGSLNKWKD